MSSLAEIDALFKKAQETMISGKSDEVRRVLWPELRDAIETTPDLHRVVRMRLRLLVLDYLDDRKLLFSDEAPPIHSLDEVLARLDDPKEKPPIWHAW